MRGKELMHGFVFYWAPFIVYVALVFYVSGQSDPTPGYQVPVSDKIAHGAEYMVMMLLGYRACVQMSWQGMRQHAMLLSLVFTLLFAISDEVHQSFVPGRTCALSDYAADTVGCVLAVIGIMAQRKQQETRFSELTPH